MKIQGHPMIYIDDTCLKVYEKGTKVKTINMIAVGEVTCFARQELIKTVVMKYGKRP